MDGSSTKWLLEIVAVQPQTHHLNQRIKFSIMCKGSPGASWLMHCKGHDNTYVVILPNQAYFESDHKEAIRQILTETILAGSDYSKNVEIMKLKQIDWVHFRLKETTEAWELNDASLDAVFSLLFVLFVLVLVSVSVWGN